MATECFDKNLLLYGGTSQAKRVLDALAATYAQVDERTAADLILFAKKYGAYLNYFDLTNTIAGDWQDILSKDVAVVIASVADWRSRDYTPFIEYLTGKIKETTTEADAKNYFKIIFDFIYSLASGLDDAFRKLTYDVSYTNYLAVSISSKLAAPLNVLTQYYQAFKAASLIDETSVFTDAQTPVDNLVFSQNFQLSALSSQWQAVITAPGITLAGVIRDDINTIITHNLFMGALQSFTDAVINLVSRTPDYLEETLENYPSHSPHYALYLAFLRLFRFSLDHLNNYTGKHLDFYYKDVLRLTNSDAVPDYVHLVFELQKNIDSHLLTNGTSFKAGKDASSHDLFYTLTDNLVIRKAAVQSLKSLYLGKDLVPVTLFGSPKADSEDGQGGKLLSADNSWSTFGNPKKASPATIGFAIASNILFLNEGPRIIALNFQCDSLTGISDADLQEIFTIQFTGKKKLFAADTYSVGITGNSFLLAVGLEGDVSPIIPYSQKLHGGDFPEGLPMVQVTVKDYKSYQKIKSVRIKTITLDVLGVIKNLSLQNDDGKINPSKPFKPFGEFPENGASFIIGSKEIFQKKLINLTLGIDWQTAPAAGTTAVAYGLLKANWNTFIDAVNITTSTVSFPGIGSVMPSARDFSPNDDYTVSSVDGFMKLELQSSSYNIKSYLTNVRNNLANTSVSLNKDSGGNVTGFTLSSPAVPDPPAPPVAKSVSITYVAQQVIAFNELTADSFALRNSFFYHLEPFGYREMHPFLTSDALTFLPVFDLDDGIAKDNGGELWIGLSNAAPEETFSLLFEVSDGSANPLKNMTEVDWYYLSGNNWLKFDHLSVTDLTNNLTRSGLVILNLPSDVTLTNSRADTGLLWVKGVVKHDTDAVCNLIAVSANGAKAQFVQDIPAGIEFTKALHPNTISKPAVADAALKKTDQPYPSFDGRVRETDDQFYLRVSERLRHKHRAVTPWDYERLTLQNYPQIHKAKCISHTGFVVNKKTNEQKYSEVLPGHVMVVTIPDLTSLTTVNPLRPYTSIGLLTEIQQYLQPLASPFVRLHLCNPQFEEIQFDFEVTFYENLDPVFYMDKLNTEIEQFLTPWAYGTTTDIEFGTRMEKSVVLNFIEERDYVDFVTCFRMNQIILREGTLVKEALYDIEEAVASTARSILVSYYNEVTKVKHLIQSPANCNCDG